jgi:hypothetical protein
MRRLLFGLILSICAPSLGLAWGDLGHRTVVEIAARNLSAKAEAMVQELLGPGPNALVKAAVWADYIKEERPDTNPWHVVEIPPAGVCYDRARDCRNDDCIVEKIKEFARTLGDRTAAKPQRVEAIKFLAHLVGDLHMPLHAYEPLSCPNGTWIRVGETSEKLHLWWDNQSVDLLGSDPNEIANMLGAQITADQRKEWTDGTPEDWANESFRIAEDFVTKYDLINHIRQGNNSEQTPIILLASVVDEVRPIVAQRLKMAGVRLAWLLNQAFE